MKIYYSNELTGTNTISLGGLKDGNTHPVEMYIQAASTVTVKGVIGDNKYDIGAYNAATYEKANAISNGVFVVLVAPYESVEITGSCTCTIYA